MQFGRGCRLWGRVCPLPSGSGWRPPAFLPLAGDGPVHSWLAFLWSLLSPLFCEQAQQYFRLELFVGKFSLFPLFFFFFSLSLGLPRFGLLSHVSSLRFPSGHSGLVLTLSNTAHTSPFSPHLLVVDTSVWATSPLGVAVRHIIYGVYLFIFPPGYVAF